MKRPINGQPRELKRGTVREDVSVLSRRSYLVTPPPTQFPRSPSCLRRPSHLLLLRRSSPLIFSTRPRYNRDPDRTTGPETKVTDFGRKEFGGSPSFDPTKRSLIDSGGLKSQRRTWICDSHPILVPVRTRLPSQGPRIERKGCGTVRAQDVGVTGPVSRVLPLGT